MITGWHFVGPRLYDGSPVPPDGKWLKIPKGLPPELLRCRRAALQPHHLRMLRRSHAMKTPHLFARAAKLLEEQPVWEYPCFAILEEKFGPLGCGYETDPDTLRFMSVFSNAAYGQEKSDAFIEALMSEKTLDKDLDNAILALCFAAAIEEAGDHPDGQETTNG